MTDLTAHLTRQAAFSRATFGPGPRTNGILDHITKEIEEVRAFYPAEMPEGRQPNHAAAAQEWVDLVILSFDGLLRALSAACPVWTLDQVAGEAVYKLLEKQGKNELRNWPDWRTAPQDKAIEHERGHHD